MKNHSETAPINYADFFLDPTKLAYTKPLQFALLSTAEKITTCTRGVRLTAATPINLHYDIIITEHVTLLKSCSIRGCAPATAAAFHSNSLKQLRQFINLKF